MVGGEIRDLETRDGWSEREGKWVGHVRSE